MKLEFRFVKVCLAESTKFPFPFYVFAWTCTSHGREVWGSAEYFLMTILQKTSLSFFDLHGCL